MTEMAYDKLRKIDVSAKVEKKNGFSYLSWAFAVDQLLQVDPDANWSYPAHQLFGPTVMVFCAVTCLGRTRTAQLPVMDHRNKPISNPDSFAVNTAMQRCLVKGIALHGLGLYLYAGEDLPADSDAKGDLGKNIPSQEAFAMAVKMREILEADVDEDAKALHVLDLHDVIKTQHDLYVKASDELFPKERSAWKAYIKAAQARAKVNRSKVMDG